MDSKAIPTPWPPAGRTPILIGFLTKLPPETVHQVFDDLPIVKVIRILCYRLDYLNECVLTHLHYGKLFSSSQDIALAVEYFTLFRETRVFRNKALAPPKSPLAQVPGPHSSTTFGDIINICQMGIVEIRACLDIPSPDLDLLTKYGRFPRPQLVDPFEDARAWLQHGRSYWQWVKEAKSNLNARKADQIKLAADLVERYPHVVKKTADPRQDVAECNISHILSRLRSFANQALRDRKLTHLYPGSVKAPLYLIEIIPYDRYLWLMLDTLEKHPFHMESPELEESFRKMVLEPQPLPTNLDRLPLLCTADKKESASQYPEEIAGHLRTALKGLAYVYNEDDVIMPRIEWEPGLNDAASQRWPRFLVKKDILYPGMPPLWRVAAAQKLKPLDAREYEWIEAFLKTVTWMEERFGSAKDIR
ncbi:AAA ATPase central domain protein [Rutstroemia sp. NJR-2017a BBW]|nr:AAA ATPase central domain protein [Rutstroemia sp. NJR-2017a BBW]